MNICRYGSDLISVESYEENNITSSIATSSVPIERRNKTSNNFWLGLASLDDLKTNTLESAAGTLVSQYSGEKLLNVLKIIAQSILELMINFVTSIICLKFQHF